MHNELAKLFEEYNNNLNKSEVDFIKDAYEMITSHDDLKKYINDLIIIDKKNSIFSGDYDVKNKNVVVNINSKSKKKKGYTEYNTRDLHFTRYLEILLHETNHAIVFREYENNNNRSIYKLIDYCCYYHAMNNKELYDNILEKLSLRGRLNYLYNVHHNMAFYELCAMRYSLDYLKKISKELEKNKELTTGFVGYLGATVGVLLRAYEDYYQKTTCGVTTSPAYDFCITAVDKKTAISNTLSNYKNDLKKMYKEDSKEYTLEERISYGLQLSNIEYDKLINEETKFQKVTDSVFQRKLIYDKNSRR